MLLDKASKNPVWVNVRGVCEITSSDNFHARIRNTIYNKAFIIMTTQFDRRFTLFLSVAGVSFQLVACDRAGVVISATYDFHNDPLVILRILAGFMFSEEIFIGYDPSITRDDEDNLLKITVADKEYDILNKIFTSETLRGRATQCWRVGREGMEFVMKDTWIQVGRQSNEIEMLRHIAGVPCVPTIIEGEDLALPNGTTDSTAEIRKGLDQSDLKVENRLHRRILMTPHGESIFTFASKKELIGALIDVVEGV